MASLTTHEITLLAGWLRGTGSNVYTLCRVRFGIKDADENVFDRLEKEGGVVKCELCGLWGSPDKSRGAMKDVCDECGGAGSPVGA